MTLEELGQLFEELDGEGYQSYMNHNDVEVVQEIPCEACGGQCYGRGRAKWAFGKMVSYRCFACCEACNHAEEF